MKRMLLNVALVMVVSGGHASEYVIEAKYSADLMPIRNIDEKSSTTIRTKDKLEDSESCRDKLDDKSIRMFVLGEAARANATDVVLKCVKYWEASECAGMYPGCQMKSEVPGPKHVYLYTSGSRVPRYLRFSSDPHAVLKTIAFSQNKKETQISFVYQTKYDEKVFSKISGKMLSCEDAINSKKFKRGIRRSYFSDPRTAAYKFVCYRVQDDRRVVKLGERTVKRN